MYHVVNQAILKLLFLLLPVIVWRIQNLNYVHVAQ